MSYFCDLERRAEKELAPGVTAKTFWQQNMLLSFVTMQPNSVVAMHTHPHEQAGTVVEGEITLTIADETRVLKVGDCYIIPGDVPHSATAHNGLARVVDIFSPVRESYQY
ncbi:MAG: cupin domain-containing protein [Anaerolineae bacterium]|nr:cupin domain-containing protein [Anaerolineae bacterium]MDW8172006.1 cupin domain-containing protein [Anaerolineae bacterium]